ncbi:MAG: FAD-binding oxidoreductase [Ilumatobacteraceae bacterium]
MTKRAGAPDTGLIDALRAAVGDDHVLVDADLRAGYETDWLNKYHGAAACVVRPGTVDEVAAVVRACADAGVAMVPQGGNTGLVGGSVPRNGEVVMSTRRLTRLDAVDVEAMQVTAGAGVTIAELQQHARAAGVDFAVDWGARESATVGGGVSTNAGGSRVVRFGTMRAQVMGVQVVLADGSVIDHLQGLPKETAGMFLPGMFVGSEGTLGIVTAARLKVVPWYRQTAAALIACDSLADAVGLLPLLRTLPSLDAVELLLPEALHVACEHLGIPAPLPADFAAAFVMVDCAADSDPSLDLARLVGDRKGVMALGPQRDQLYRIRDHVTIAIGAKGVPVKLDVAVPVHRLDELVARVRDVVADIEGAELVVFGHLAEGNLHVNVLGATGQAADVTESVLSIAIQLGGTISAEHGIGVAKAAWLERLKGPAAVAALRAVKRALDPQGILNPGVLLDVQLD